MANLSTTQLFTGDKQTDLYAKFRPVYSNEVFEKIAAFHQESSDSFDCAIDVGCGSGQSTVPLAKYFKKVCMNLNNESYLVLSYWAKYINL